MFTTRWSTAEGRRAFVREGTTLPVVCGMAAMAAIPVGAIACNPEALPPVSAPPASQPPPGEVSPAGDIPDDQAFVTYTAPDRSYTVKVPEGWAATTKAGGVEFTDKLNTTIAIASVPTVVTPTVDSVTALELPRIAASTPGYRPGTVSHVDRAAGQAILITYGADSAPSPVTGKVVAQAVERYEFYQSGRQVAITLSGSTGADDVVPWRIVTDSLSWSA